MTQQDSHASPHNPRHRLVGALVLLALAVIFVPMVLDFRSDYEGGIRESNLPPKPKDFHVEVLPLPLPGDAAVAPVPAPPPVTVREQRAAHKSKAASQPVPDAASPPVMEKPAPPPRQQKRPAPRPVPPVPAAQNASPAPGWVVQVGSFSSAKNAGALRDRLQDQGFDALVDEVRVAGQPAYRVLVGPLPDKSRAEAQRSRLQKQARLKGIVIRYEGYER
ncbi:MAG: SPOR domain-containing protein [Gammaproteobacteria bacterium]